MKTPRWWDLPAALLLMAALLTAAGRLVATAWVDHLSLVQALSLMGLVAGLALGQSRFPPLLATIFGVLYGAFAVPWQLGLTAGYLSGEARWNDRLVVMANRVVDALLQFVQRKPVYDPILFLSATCALGWALSVHAGYALTRRANPWRVILPPGLAALLIQTSDLHRERGVWYLAAYSLFSLLLLARLTFLRLRRQWQRDDARIPPLVGHDLSYAVAAVVVLLIFMAWTAPAMADVLPSARQIWEEATSPLEERMDKLFASLRRQGKTVTAANYYGDEFVLGRGRELSDALITSVQVPDVPSSVRLYWRARVYDTYADGRWSTSALTMTREVGLGSPVGNFPELEGRRPLTFTFTTPKAIATLYTAPQPRSVSRSVEVAFAENPDGTIDVASLQATPPVGAGASYVAHSSVADVTISQMREAGTDYPQWILDRYLDTPDTMTARMRDLATVIAADRETPYDVVAAVTRYLRDAIRYSETITDTLPPDQEPLDWFLFDVQVGFCNYYASSEVILLRSLGIPARLAVGFAEGEPQRGTDTTLVYERNAHAWPEVYFPGLGWVEFEPTVSQDPILRPLGEVDTGDDVPRLAAGGDTDDRWLERLARLEGLDEIPPRGGVPTPSTSLWERARGLAWTLPILLGAVLLVLAWRARRRRGFQPFPVLLERGIRRIGWRPPSFLRRWARRATLTPVEKAYGEIDRALRRLGSPPAPADTAAERVGTLASLVPPASEPTRRLLAEYQAATYSSYRPNAQVAREAARSIRGLSWRAKLRDLFVRV